MNHDEELPWQAVADSPTVKTYTDWRIFEEELQRGEPKIEYETPFRICVKPTLVLSFKEPVISDSLPSNISVRIIHERPPLYASIKNRMEEIHSRSTRYVTIVEVHDGPEVPLNVIIPGGDGLNSHHLVVKLKRGSNAVINVMTYSLSKGVKSIWIELLQEPGSRIVLRTLSLDMQPTYHMVSAALGRGARIKSDATVFAGRMSRYHESYILSAKAEATTRVGAYAASNHKADIITDAILREPEASVHLSARGAVDNRGYLVHRGVARVENMARDSSAVIDSEIRVLGKEGRGYSVPMLEVFTGYVKEARHSASVLRLTDDEEAYLRSRGLSIDDIGLLMSLEAINYPEVHDKLCIDAGNALRFFRSHT